MTDDVFREERCLRCGACCDLGARGRCEYLEMNGSRATCAIYGFHHGLHFTTCGTAIRCGTIRERVERGDAPVTCAYLKAWEAQQDG